MGLSLAQQLSALKYGDHICLIYETFEEQMAAVACFISTGIAAGERCVYVVGDRAPEQILTALAERGVAASEETTRGSLLISSRRDADLVGGVHDPRALIDLLHGSPEEALSAGFSGLRITADVTSQPGEDNERLIEWEALLNNTIGAPGSKMLTLCQYDRRRFPPAMIENVLRVHRLAIIGGMVCPNPYYAPPEAELTAKSAAARVDRMIARLRQAGLTARKQNEDSLRLSEESYRTLVETIDDGVHIKGLDGRYLMVNSAAVRRFGLAKEEIVGRTALELYAPEEAAQVMASDRQVMETGTTLDAEETHHYPGERAVRHIHVRKVPLRDRNGRVAGVVTVSRDITERKQAEKAQHDAADRLKRAMEGIVDAMSTVTEMRDPYTAGHQRRVSRLAFAIAEEMGLPEAEREALRLAGSIHDIGKISVPAEILSKSGRLSEVELQMIRAHPRAGYDILKGIAFPWPIAEPILQHHERLDGSGYPDGLAGDSILLEARVLAVADVVEAMCSHRPYRPALEIGKALDEISRQKGILYEAEVVNACLRLFARGDFAFQ